MLFSYLTLSACTSTEPASPPEIRRFQTALPDLERHLNDGFTEGLPNMFQVGERYIDTLQEWGDESCPQFNERFNEVDGHWVDDCVTADGNRFYGFANFSALSVQEEDEFGNGGIFSSVWGSFDAIHSSGEIRTIGGLGQMAIATQDGGLDMNLRGSFWLDDDESWMKQGSSSFEIHGVVTDILVLTGGVQYPEITLVFDELEYDVNRCGGTAYGALKIRDTSGYWFDWYKHPCESCAVVGWEGYSVGKVCVGDTLDNAIESLVQSTEYWMEGG